MNTVKIVPLVFLAIISLSGSGCAVFRATGNTVTATGRGVGHAISETGEGLGEAVAGTGRAIHRAADEVAD